jgi:hypothetical protein
MVAETVLTTADRSGQIVKKEVHNSGVNYLRAPAGDRSYAAQMQLIFHVRLQHGDKLK